jgi:nucleotide-binding universal stress UspA family protein
MAAKPSCRRLQVDRGYRRLLVPLDAGTESVEALGVACRLAADDWATITAVAVIEVPPLLPLDTHLIDAEDAARRLLERAGATGNAYGVNVTTKIVRARDAGAAIVEQAVVDRDELIVIGATRSRLAESPKRNAPDAVLHVLRGAPCRVMVVSNTSREAA